MFFSFFSGVRLGEVGEVLRTTHSVDEWGEDECGDDEDVADEPLADYLIYPKNVLDVTPRCESTVHLLTHFLDIPRILRKTNKH